ncbi:MAG: hypothetical protein ACERKN_14090 [Velocimicrobium sp.]
MDYERLLEKENLYLGEFAAKSRIQAPSPAVGGRKCMKGDR